MKQWLDRMTGIVTMYKLVILLLGTLGVIALVLSLFGVIVQNPLALLASAAVAIVATCSTSLLFATIGRVTPHLDSALITALLIFFIMKPTFDPVGLVLIAAAGALASASKMLLAVRGRHVLNPAAFGVFVVTVFGFATGLASASYAVWWIGVPELVIPTLIFGFLVLYRTRRLTLGLVFVALAIIVATINALLRAAPVNEVLYSLITQSPLLFFVAFMFSEPLTLPPRRWQQIIEAAVVAFLLTTPFTLGLVNNSPQFALLIGNLIGFAFGQRRGIRMSYLGKRQLSPTTWELSFQPARPVRFLPGQYMELTIPHRKADFRGSRRYFSISSAPAADGPITFAITVPSKSSSFKQALLDLEPGATVTGTGVGGDFALPREVDEPLLLIAGGIGITPFASQLAHATERGEKRDVVVVYANSTPGDLPYGELLERSGAQVVLFAPTLPSPLPTGWQYGGSGRVTGERLASTVPDVAKRRAFISGPPALVHDLRKALRGLGARRVHTDYFSGY